MEFPIQFFPTKVERELKRMAKYMLPLPEDDPKIKKKFDQWLKKQKAKPTAKEQAEIKKLEKEALSLWKQVIRKKAGKRCEYPGCKKTKWLNAHHIESYSVNKGLRYNPMNGILLCSTHHKFGRLSAHKSFCFVYQLLKNQVIRLDYLQRIYATKVEITKDFLEGAIRQLTAELKR